MVSLSASLDTTERPWNRRATIGLAVLVLGALLSLGRLVHPWFDVADETNDAAIYIACARSMLAGEGYSYLGEPFTVRPPGMSALIAPILAWRGSDFRALNLLVSLCGVACVALLFVHARHRLGEALAFLVAASLWLSDPFQLLCNRVLSDVPGAALVLACLALERWAARAPSIRRDILLGACIGASTWLRSATLLLVPAILAARFFARAPGRDRRPREAAESFSRFLLARVLPLAVAALLVKLPWDVRCAFHHPEPPVDQNFLYSYSTAMWHVDGGDPSSPRRELADVAARVPGRVPQLLSLLGSRMRSSASPGAAVGGVAVLALALLASWRRRGSAELFVLILSGVLLVYFGFRDRLALPIWILLFAAAAEGLLILLRGPLGGRPAKIAVGLVLVALPALDFHPRRGWSEIERTDALYRRVADETRAAIPPDVRVAAGVGWHDSVFLERPVWSLFFAMRRAGGPQGAEQVLARRSIGAIVLLPIRPSDRGLLAWARERCGAPVSSGDALVFRVPR